MILVDHMYHEAVVIQGTNITTATGKPVVLGELFVVNDLDTGHGSTDHPDKAS